MTIKTNSLALAALACISIQSVSKASWMDPGFNSFSNSFTLGASYLNYAGGTQTVTGSGFGFSTSIQPIGSYGATAGSNLNSFNDTSDALRSFNSRTDASLGASPYGISSASSSSEIIINLNSYLHQWVEYANNNGITKSK